MVLLLGYFQNLALPGLYTPSTCPADTPMTSDTSVSTQSSSDLVTPDDDLFKRRHHQQLITPTSSDLATPDDDMPKSCLRRQQVTPTSSDLATPEEEIMKTCKLRKHQRVLGKLSWEDRPVDSREKVISAGALLTSLKSAALADPSMLWLPLQRPRSLNLQLRGNTTGQQVAALAAVTASKCCQHRHSRPLIGKLYVRELQMCLCKSPFTHFFQGESCISEGNCRWLRITSISCCHHSLGY